MTYHCTRCKANIEGKGLEKHYESKRCDDRLQAYQLGFASAKERIVNLINMQGAR